jgi:hypothetical protein
MIDEKDDQEPVSLLTYGGAKLPSADNPPPSYCDRVQSMLERSRVQRMTGGVSTFHDLCPMSDCRHTVG